MIFKVFYQVNRKHTPRRETTQTLYLEFDVQSEKEGIIAGRELLSKNTDYTVEFIEALSDSAVKYERENGDFSISTF